MPSDTSSVLLWSPLSFAWAYILSLFFFFLHLAYCSFSILTSIIVLGAFKNPSISVILIIVFLSANDFILHPISVDHSQGRWLDGVFSNFCCTS